MFTDSGLWFVARTKTMHEFRARVHLEERGVRVYLPRAEVTVRHARYTKQIHKALFPSYLFVQCDAERLFDTVRWCPGVAGLLPETGEAVPVGPDILEAVRSLEDTDGVVRKRDRLQAGDQVRILEGPFRDLQGIFERWHSDKARVSVLLNILQRYTRVTLQGGDLEKL